MVKQDRLSGRHLVGCNVESSPDKLLRSEIVCGTRLLRKEWTGKEGVLDQTSEESLCRISTQRDRQRRLSEFGQ